MDQLLEKVETLDHEDAFEGDFYTTLQDTMLKGDDKVLSARTDLTEPFVLEHCSNSF